MTHVLADQWSRFDTEWRTLIYRHLRAKRLFIMCAGKKTLTNAACKGFESPCQSFIFLFWYRFPNYWFGMDNCWAFVLAMGGWEERSRDQSRSAFWSFIWMCTVKADWTEQQHVLNGNNNQSKTRIGSDQRKTTILSSPTVRKETLSWLVDCFNYYSEAGQTTSLSLSLVILGHVMWHTFSCNLLLHKVE